jgi:hypothetical protein
MEAELESPERVLTFEDMSALAAEAFADHGNLVALSYEVGDDGTERPVSTMDLARAIEA